MAGSVIGKAFVDLGIIDSKLKKGLTGAKGNMKSFMLSAGAAKLAVAGLFATMAGAAAKGLHAFSKQQDAVNDLKVALSLQGAEGGLKRLTDLASKFQDETIHGDEAIIKMQADMLAMGAPAAKMEEMTKVAIGLSSVLGDDLNAAGKAAALAMQGVTGELGEKIAAVRQAKTEEERLAVVIKKGNELFEIQKGKTKTLSGGFKQAANLTGDLWEKVGDLVQRFTFLPRVMQKVIDKLKVWNDKFAEFLDSKHLEKALVRWEFQLKRFQVKAESTMQAIAVAIAQMLRPDLAEHMEFELPDSKLAALKRQEADALLAIDNAVKKSAEDRAQGIVNAKAKEQSAMFTSGQQLIKQAMQARVAAAGNIAGAGGLMGPRGGAQAGNVGVAENARTQMKQLSTQEKIADLIKGGNEAMARYMQELRNRSEGFVFR